VGLLANLAQAQVTVAPAQASGKITLLRVHDVETKYGPEDDEINVEVVIWLNTHPGKAFGFKLRDDDNRPVRQGILDLLRDAFNHNWAVTIDYVGADLSDPDPAKDNFVIIRAWLTAPRAMEVEKTFQYAVKFICGKATSDEGVAPGHYYTAINVHNPWYKKIAFKKKFAIALPLQKSGRFTRFFDVVLGDDQALEIDCLDIFERTADISTAEFRKGFAVIESDVEIDIVSVYTSANFETNQIITQDIERVPPRVILHELPDLVPVPDEDGSFCRRSGDSLLVTVRNQGLGFADSSKTEVNFFGLGSFTEDTPSLDPEGQTNLLFDTPANFWVSEGSKEFKITADVTTQVTEANEGNNVATGLCTII
jgi:hypothetical protein